MSGWSLSLLSLITTVRKCPLCFANLSSVLSLTCCLFSGKKVDWNVYKSDKWRTTVPDFSLFSASAYAYSKLAVVQFSLELQRKLQKAGLHHISAYCVDPGAGTSLEERHNLTLYFFLCFLCALCFISLLVFLCCAFVSHVCSVNWDC